MANIWGFCKGIKARFTHYEMTAWKYYGVTNAFHAYLAIKHSASHLMSFAIC